MASVVPDLWSTLEGFSLTHLWDPVIVVVHFLSIVDAVKWFNQHMHMFYTTMALNFHLFMRNPHIQSSEDLF